MKYLVWMLIVGGAGNALATDGEKRLKACDRRVIAEQGNLSVEEARRRLELMGRSDSGGGITYIGDDVGRTLKFAAEQFGMDPVALEAELASGVAGDNIEKLRAKYQELSDSMNY